MHARGEEALCGPNIGKINWMTSTGWSTCGWYVYAQRTFSTDDRLKTPHSKGICPAGSSTQHGLVANGTCVGEGRRLGAFLQGVRECQQLIVTVTHPSGLLIGARVLPGVRR